MIKNWHILVTRSRFEKKSYLRLTQDGFESFLPLHKVLSQWSDRKKWIEKPLFPGYIFINFSASERYKVLSTEGIARVVRFENKDYIVNEKVINGIKNQLDNNKEIEIVSTLNLTLGDKVNIINGPFKGVSGVLTQINGKAKVLVLIEAIGQGCVIEIKGTDLTKI